MAAALMAARRGAPRTSLASRLPTRPRGHPQDGQQPDQGVHQLGRRHVPETEGGRIEQMALDRQAGGPHGRELPGRPRLPDLASQGEVLAHGIGVDLGVKAASTA